MGQGQTEHDVTKKKFFFEQNETPVWSFVIIPHFAFSHMLCDIKKLCKPTTAAASKTTTSALTYGGFLWCYMME
jgi:hypothetical protein